MDREKRYLLTRILKGKIQSIPFYLCRIFRIRERKIVFCCIEGTAGYSCNPKYIAEELIRRGGGYELVWLVNDLSKQFPGEIRKVKNTLWNRAYHLTTARVWIDNSRKQLEVRKRRGQTYIQTWHAKLGFKPTCLDRGASFSRIAYLVSRHDSDMTDYVLSNSKWYDDTLPTGMLYGGPVLRTGSPRCDVLVNRAGEMHGKVREAYRLPGDSKIMMYAPTFRGGSQGTSREIHAGGQTLDYDRLVRNLEDRFGGRWYVMLRLHPQLVARGIESGIRNDRLIDVSREDDMYGILAGCDAFLTDYSSAAFDAAVMRMPVFLYCDDYREYQEERGKLLWAPGELPFPQALDAGELEERILRFDEAEYGRGLDRLSAGTGMTEDGMASARVADKVGELCGRWGYGDETGPSG